MITKYFTTDDLICGKISCMSLVKQVSGEHATMDNGLNIEAAIWAASMKPRGNAKVDAAINGMLSVHEWLDIIGAFNTRERLGSMIGQCAHESSGFQRTQESLYYSVKRLIEVWPGRYPNWMAAEPYSKNPEKLANHTYANRMGNGDEASGDGWRYRGRGWIQLTGRANYRARGLALDLDLEKKPYLALDPGVRWMIAASFMNTQKRHGKTAFQWADQGNIRMVTRTINGGAHGLDDRKIRTARAIAAL